MKTKIKISICTVYIIIWCLYVLQGYFGIRGILSQSLLMVNLGISIYYTIYAFRNYNIGSFLKVLSVFVAILTVYGVFLILGGEKSTMPPDYKPIDSYTYLKSIYISLLPVFPFYVFTRKGLLTEKQFRHWIWVFLIVATVSFQYDYQDSLRKAILAGSNREEFTNNAGYLFLSLLPYVVFFKGKPILQYGLTGYCLFFLFSGMKRGAIFIAFVIIILMILQMTKGYKGVKKIESILLSLILLWAGVSIIHHLQISSDYFNERLVGTVNGESSHRDVLYLTFYNHFVHNTSFLQFYFGSGALATLEIAGQYAHNDWLELAINQGLLGVVIYGIYWISAAKEWRLSDKSQTYSQALGLVLLAFFLKSWFSMSYGDMPFYTTLLIGYSLAQNHILQRRK